MSTTLTRPAATPSSATGRRSLTAAALAAGVALLAALAASLLTSPERVVPTFAQGTAVIDSAWGNAEVFGVDGSRILSYQHGTEVEMTVPWAGGPVAGARLGDGPVHLLTVTDVRDAGDELRLTVRRDNCRWFHERAIDMFPSLTVLLADGGTTEVLFDRPLFVKSPMLAACPDRTVDRQDHVRSARGG